MTSSTSTVKTSEPRERLLSTASELFYREGIHSVGVDRIVDAAKVTRATFYRHFPGKEDLVKAYLDVEDSALREQFANAFAAIDDPEGVLEAVIYGIADDVTRNHTRGCPFINASAEYPDPESPVRIAIRAHRSWFHRTLTEALSAASRPDPDSGARALVLLRDAALVGGYLDGPDAMRETFVSASRALAGLS